METKRFSLICHLVSALCSKTRLCILGDKKDSPVCILSYTYLSRLELITITYSGQCFIVLSHKSNKTNQCTEHYFITTKQKLIDSKFKHMFICIIYSVEVA